MLLGRGGGAPLQGPLLRIGWLNTYAAAVGPSNERSYGVAKEEILIKFVLTIYSLSAVFLPRYRFYWFSRSA